MSQQNLLKNKKILLTGDDGYNSIGIRLLISLLKYDNELKVVATQSQQSGVGGVMNLTTDIEFERTEVDGIEAIVVKGSPVDAMEVAPCFFKSKFDLIISGVNLGENVTYAIISSGTFAAAVRGIGCNLAPKAIVLSFKAHFSNTLRSHNGIDPINEYLDYPGKAIIQTLDTIIEQGFWDKNIVNVNFPANPTTEYKITQLDPNIIDYWDPGFVLDEKHNKVIQSRSSYPYGTKLNKDVNLDTGALTHGFISINPITFS
jgi:5'-nucleotidase